MSVRDAVFPHFRIVLVEPEIPNNTGNIGRTCVGTSCELHLVGKLGFEINDKQLRRAGLDYWPHLKWYQHANVEAWLKQVRDPERVFFFSTKAKKSLYEASFQAGDWLVFGCETRGLEESLLRQHDAKLLKIPQYGPIRSLNLANAVAVSVYEGLRQIAPPARP